MEPEQQFLVRLKRPTRGFQSSKLYSEGQYNEWMGIYGGGTKFPSTPQSVEQKDNLLKFVKKFPKEINPTMWTKMIKEITEKKNFTPQEVDHYFLTQININSIWETMDNLGVERNKAHTIMDRFGYTGSACIPMALNDAFEKGKIKKDDLIIFMGFWWRTCVCKCSV